MSLPPGYSAMPVAGIDATNDPELAKAAAEVNAWVQYLLHPETHDGPRMIVNPGAYGEDGYNGRLVEDVIAESPNADDPTELDGNSAGEVRPILDEHKGDPGVFFRVAKAISGVKASTMEPAYNALARGTLTWSGDRQPPEGHLPASDALRYAELHPARGDWREMRKTWDCQESWAADEYENDFIGYQVRIENAMHLVAEYLAKYRAAFAQASKDLAQLMTRFTEICGAHDFTGPPAGSTKDVDWSTVAISSVVGAAVTVLTGGTAAAVGIALIGDVVVATLTAAEKGGQQTPRKLADSHFLCDVANDFLEEADRIERELAEAISGRDDDGIDTFWEKLGVVPTSVDGLEDKVKTDSRGVDKSLGHEMLPGDEKTWDKPRYPNYLKRVDRFVR